MKTKKRLYSVLIFSLVFLFFTGTAQAIIYFDADHTMALTGKIETRLTFRTEDARGFTFPQIDAGDLVQHRNLLYLEWTHDLSKATGLNLKYRVVGRFLYDGLYDYGPEEFRDVRRANKHQIDDFKMDAQLWEAYVDYTPGNFFLRVGRQNLAWGETDVFRLLDNINPLDNTFGFSFENLDDRRIPLPMVRASYNFGKVAGIAALTLEGFWNPGFLPESAGNKVAPLAPFGTPYALPSPPLPIPLSTLKPERTMQNSRWGFRLQGVIGENFNFNLAHYQSYEDNPAGRVVINPIIGPVQELLFKPVQITGGSVSFFERHIDSVVRSEVAWVWNERVFIPQINAPLLFGKFEDGELPTKGLLRFMVGLDRALWIRPLNPTAMFNFSFQYFGELTPHFDERQRTAVQSFPTGEFLPAHKYSQTMTLLVFTNYIHGKLNPQVAVAWDPRGAWLIIPQVEYIYEPFRFKLQYGAIAGKFTGIGFFRDRDQISLTVGCLF
jgi:hypothetical protein